ncbi:hypothetical protein HPB50_000717 [Hyalomma asiaticum]|uniref:Uncharacterized protein n=1 Tax=Hyalomma asiaticum TaxID=266040 RepID=A0ACB7SS73_HYAAI|nr:hypothetical protein HPB50_000717 [Hyalomma asiaticum]
MSVQQEQAAKYTGVSTTTTTAVSTVSGRGQHRKVRGLLVDATWENKNRDPGEGAQAGTVAEAETRQRGPTRLPILGARRKSCRAGNVPDAVDQITDEKVAVAAGDDHSDRPEIHCHFHDDATNMEGSRANTHARTHNTHPSHLAPDPGKPNCPTANLATLEDTDSGAGSRNSASHAVSKACFEETKWHDLSPHTSQERAVFVRVNGRSGAE